MSTTPPPRDSARPTEHDRLIEAIYRIALDPQSYDDFMDRWGGYVNRRLLSRADTKSAPEPANAPELTSHFAIATRLLDQTMPPPTPLDSRSDGTGDGDTRGAPRFLIDRAGRIVWHNVAAERLLGLRRGSTMDDLPLDPGPMAALRRLTDALGEPRRAGRTLPLMLMLPLGDAGEVMHAQAEVVPDGTSDEVVVVAPLTTHWPAAMTTLLRDDFGLTPSEAEICEWIARGHSAALIAEVRTSALATVRTQIKRIMAKMHTAAQPELVRLLHLLMRLADSHPGGIAATPPAGPDVREIRVGDRRMPVDLHGPEGGAPVIFLHGMLDGTGITPECAAVLHRLNLRLVCPNRPFFGAAEGDRGPTATAPARLARDIARLIHDMGLKRPVLMGHMAGAVYAYATGAELEHCAGIVNVAGGVPMLGPGQFTAMAPRQRLVAYTARYSPSILPFIIRAGIRQMRTGGERRFLLSLYENTPCDLEIATRPEVQEILRAGYRFAVAQGHRAFEIDSQHVVQDWSALAQTVQVPVRLVHGVGDPVVTIQSVRDFATRHGVELTEVEGAGQLVFYKAPEIVLGAARALLDQT